MPAKNNTNAFESHSATNGPSLPLTPVDGARFDAPSSPESTFFNDILQLVMLDGVAIPHLVARKTAANEPKHIKIWSAGCATGEEVYTLACVATEALREHEGWTFSVLASDPSMVALSTARAGFYPKTSMAAIPADVVEAHFDDCGDEIRASEHLRKCVSFLRHNLRDRLPDGTFDVVVCDGVMSTMPPEEQARLSHALAENVVGDGFLFVGRAERVDALEADFRERIEARGAFQKRI